MKILLFTVKMRSKFPILISKFSAYFCLSKLCTLNMYPKCFELRFLGIKLTVTFSFVYLINLYLMSILYLSHVDSSFLGLIFRAVFVHRLKI